MTQNNPIQILDDDENVEQNKKLFEQEQAKHEFLRAQMGSRFDIIVAILKHQMKGTPEEKDENIRQRITKFFCHQPQVKIDLKDGNFCPRIEPQYESSSVYPVNNEIILYGVDFLNVRKIKQMFLGLQPVISWLDDSNCKVTFPSSENAKKAIESNLRGEEARVKMEEEMEENLPRCWMEFKPYYQLTFERRVLCRYATNEQKDIRASKNRNFVLYNKAKRKYEETLLKDNIPRYKKIIRDFGYLQDTDYRRKKRENIERWRDNQNYDRRSNRRNRDDGYSYNNNRSRNERNDDRGRRRNFGNRGRRSVSKSRSQISKSNRRSVSRSRSRSVSASNGISFILDVNQSLRQGMSKMGLDDDGFVVGGDENRQKQEEEEMEENLSSYPQPPLDDHDDDNKSEIANKDKFSYNQYIEETEKKEEEEEENNKNKLTLIVLD